MKTPLNRSLISLGLVLGTLLAPKASADGVSGKVVFLQTLPEEIQGDVHHARFRVKISQSNCGFDTTPKDRWIHVRSGRMDGLFANNATNFKVAYSTLLTAFLTGDKVQIDGVSSCDASVVQTIDLWTGAVGIFF